MIFGLFKVPSYRPDRRDRAPAVFKTPCASFSDGIDLHETF